MSQCHVSWKDEGIKHSVAVDAESLYEAAVKGVAQLRAHGYEPAGLHKLEIEVVTIIKHELIVQKLYQWLESPSRKPKDIVEKERLREILR